MIEGIGILMKIKLKDKTPPCSISFKKPNDHILKVFFSHELREPTEANNHGSKIFYSSRMNADGNPGSK